MPLIESAGLSLYSRCAFHYACALLSSRRRSHERRFIFAWVSFEGIFQEISRRRELPVIIAAKFERRKSPHKNPRAMHTSEI